MRRMLQGIILIMMLIGCNTNQPIPTTSPFVSAPVPDLLHDNYEIYTAILLEVYGVRTLWVIEQDTISRAGDRLVANGKLPALRSDTLAGYLAQNTQRQSITAVFTGKDSSFILVDQADFSFKGCQGMISTCFDRPKFDTAFPEAGGIIWLSGIGYSSDRTQALVSTQQADEHTSGTIFMLLLARKGGQWKIVDRYEIQWII